MDLSIIIVSWNVKDKLRDNLTALFASLGDYKYEVFVVDNASQDGSADMVSTEFSKVHLIKNTENVGFSKANNQAIKQSVGRYILLLNPDMRVESDTLVKILAWAEANTQATVSGCQLIDEKGQTIKQVRKFPRLFDQLLITLKVPHVFPMSINQYLVANFDYSQAAMVDSIRGAFFLINRAGYKKLSGGLEPLLDERYFIWFEEVDFCQTVYKIGGQVWYTPAARCLDYVGASFRQIERSRGQGYFSDSMLKYFDKWRGRWETAILRAVWKLIKLFV